MALTGRAVTAAVPQVGTPSHTKLTTVTFQIPGVTSTATGKFTVQGTAAAPPTTFGDFEGTPQVLAFTDYDNFQQQLSVASGNYNDSGTTSWPLGVTFGTAGHHLYLATIATGSPISSTPLEEVVDLGVLAA